ncbi:MAG: hypothetical protein ABII07_05005 [Patescibacteria group bacterium]|nr:hypothetical protein [Patescibacteria group bacterium]
MNNSDLKNRFSFGRLGLVILAAAIAFPGGCAHLSARYKKGHVPTDAEVDRAVSDLREFCGFASVDGCSDVVKDAEICSKTYKPSVGDFTCSFMGTGSEFGVYARRLEPSSGETSVFMVKDGDGGCRAEWDSNLLGGWQENFEDCPEEVESTLSAIKEQLRR